MHDSEDLRDDTHDERPKAKPPYFFLIPVAVGLIAFVGYQTVRMGSDARTEQSPYAIDTSVAQAVVDHGVITVHPHARSSRPVTVAVATPKREASASAAPSPSTEPSSPPSTSPKPTPSHAPTAHQVARASKPENAHRAENSDESIATAPVPHITHTADARSAATITTTINAPAPQQQQVAAASDAGTTPPITDAPVVVHHPAPAATAKPVQVAAAPPAAPATINASDRVVEARMIYAATPDYPDIARDQGARGTSVVFVTVDPAGTIVHMSIASSSGNPSLDRAALSAARSSRYVAPKVDGKPATETYRVTYDFSP